MSYQLPLDEFDEVLADVKAGKIVVIVDDEDRENEGDLMIAAELTTSEAIQFMFNEGKGLICVSLPKSRLTELAIPYQVTDNTTPLGTNFAVSIDHRSVVGRGVTASARAATIRATVDPSSGPTDFIMPGYVFPLGAADGGVLKRVGQTEGSLDLARLAGLQPAGVICEVMGEDGTMLAGPDLEAYCKKHQLKITSVQEIANWRLRNEVRMRRVAECEIPDGAELYGASQEAGPELKVIVYVDDVDDQEQVVFVVGEPTDDCLVRIHSECLTGDVFGSRRCDCGPQFDGAMRQMYAEGSGVLVYLHQEGRGIGILNKIKAYGLQDQGLDTVDANLELGLEVDARDYRVGAQILRDLELSSVRLMTNNPDKVKSLGEFGVKVSERIGIETEVDEFNEAYMKTKKERLGHLLEHL